MAKEISEIANDFNEEIDNLIKKYEKIGLKNIKVKCSYDMKIQVKKSEAKA